MPTQLLRDDYQTGRRRFLLLAGAGFCAAGRVFAAAPLTAREVIARIQKNVGVPWLEKTVDTFKIGNPDTAVTGIATSFSATLDVCRRAKAAGRNLLIVHEPTFYNHEDLTNDLTGEVYRAKRDFIEQNNLVVWRFHDHWHMRRPDGILTGMAEMLGWEKQRSPQDPHLFNFSATTLQAFAQGIQQRLKVKTMRIIGDPAMKVGSALLYPGFNNRLPLLGALERPDGDVVILGETREWEAIEYARDAVAAGKKKALILLGHVPSEEGGMKECARWLKTFVTEVPVEYLPGGEPFWTVQG